LHAARASRLASRGQARKKISTLRQLGGWHTRTRRMARWGCILATWCASPLRSDALDLTRPIWRPRFWPRASFWWSSTGGRHCRGQVWFRAEWWRAVSSQQRHDDPRRPTQGAAAWHPESDLTEPLGRPPGAPHRPGSPARSRSKVKPSEPWAKQLRQTQRYRSRPPRDRSIIRVLLVDEQTAFRQALAFVLQREPDISVTAQTGSLAEASAVLQSIDVAVGDTGSGIRFG
jgi:hypothetical protein